MPASSWASSAMCWSGWARTSSRTRSILRPSRVSRRRSRSSSGRRRRADEPPRRPARLSASTTTAPRDRGAAVCGRDSAEPPPRVRPARRVRADRTRGTRESVRDRPSTPVAEAPRRRHAPPAPRCHRPAGPTSGLLPLTGGGAFGLTPSWAGRSVITIVNDNNSATTPARAHGPDLILHPVRMRLIVALGAGAPMTAAELQERMPDVPPATLYRHLNALRRGGILAVAEEPRTRHVEERRTRGAVERHFVLHPGAASLLPADLANATPDDHLRWFASFVASLLGAFGRYVAADTPDLARDGVGYRVVVLQLSDAELE